MNGIMNEDKIAQLRKLYQEDRSAKSLLDWLAGRQNSAQMTNVERAVQVTGESYGDIVTVFRKLDNAGLGRFMVGRKGHKTRIEWSFDVKSLGNAARGSSMGLKEAPERGISDADEDSGGQDVDDSTLLSHEFQVRPDFKLMLVLPADLSAREADRIANWIRTLPFDA